MSDISSSQLDGSTSMTLNTSSVEADRRSLNETFHYLHPHYHPQPHNHHPSPTSSAFDLAFESKNPSMTHLHPSARVAQLEPEEYARINAKEAEFLEKNKTGWIHGYHVPYSVITYDSYSQYSTKKKLIKHYDQHSFTPKMVINQIEHSAFSRKDSDASIAHIPIQEQVDQRVGEVLIKEESAGAFSGYFSIPRVSYNVPNTFKHNKHQLRLMSDVPKLTFQNNFTSDNLTYVFGGLYVCKLTTFKNLGLPSDVDISQISVYFPYELPPFVNVKMLTSPFMQPYKQFFMFNASRGSVTFQDTSSNKDFPGHILSMSSTKISPRHFFFYGGFELQTTSVSYNPEINRWILHKKLIPNEDGYIIDTISLKFTKIKLERKSGGVEIARLGTAICSNIYENPTINNNEEGGIPGRIPSPPVFTHKQSTPVVRIPTQQNNPSTTSVNTKGSNAPKLENSPGLPPSAVSRSRGPSPLASMANTLKHPQLHRIITNPSTNTSSSSQYSSQDSTSSAKTPGKQVKIKIGPNIAAQQIQTSGSFNSPQTPSSATAKMVNVLGKSTRIFHRHRHTPSDGVQMANTNSQSGSSKESPLRTPSVKSPHPLKHSYSTKRKPRSDSNSSGGSTNNDSRGVSPVIQSSAAKERPFTLSQSSFGSDYGGKTDYSAGPVSSISAGGSSSAGGMPSAGSGSGSVPIGSTGSTYSFPASATSATTGTFFGEPIMETTKSESEPERSATPSTVADVTPFVDGTPVATATLCPKAVPAPDRILSDNSLVYDETESIDSDATKTKNPLFDDAISPTSLASVSVFVFGGFTVVKNKPHPHKAEEEVEDDGDLPHKSDITRFKATNDLLKIELATKEDPLCRIGFSFLPEALVFTVGTDRECDIVLDDEDGAVEWPEPRGYFASALIDHRHGVVEENCTLDVSGKRDEILCGIDQRVQSPAISTTGSTGSFQFGGGGQGSGGGGGSSIGVGGGGGGGGGGVGGGVGASSMAAVNEAEAKPEKFFCDKAFMVQGGCNESMKFFGDFYMFVFESCKWEKVITYAYDYFNIPLAPDEDDDASRYTKENLVENPELKEAELRSCHHSALYYKNEERDYLFFLGGLRNDFLRHYDKEPYKSDKFDVSRFSRLPLATTNENLLRIAVLNIQTQTWRFLRYYFDVNHAITKSYIETVGQNPVYLNARMSGMAGTISLCEKTIIMGQGTVIFVPEKKDDMAVLKELIPLDEVLWGGHALITFPAAEAELDMVTGMFNALVSQCHNKCINKTYNESDITKQESLCLDRCVAKYFETNVQVGENMQRLGQTGALMGRR
ncbi:uncharacterized protein J8A68_000491 [[Candida] subhashii]|uniref:Mitochondrial import inner membrane translocase subunit TIM10 n=1 Tax=[Candida] subhashii TaxID=561895 RepID=A0A8J5US46_9ASCO|nr:uncharacterized protein J8A68_000491 [[Candida] subhashii]KAG7666061.1 hypothetical protein J8A68_000491 [[Candida] subhashii]